MLSAAFYLTLAVKKAHDVKFTWADHYEYIPHIYSNKAVNLYITVLLIK